MRHHLAAGMGMPRRARAEGPAQTDESNGAHIEATVIEVETSAASVAPGIVVENVPNGSVVGETGILSGDILLLGSDYPVRRLIPEATTCARKLAGSAARAAGEAVPAVGVASRDHERMTEGVASKSRCSEVTLLAVRFLSFEPLAKRCLL